MTTSDDVPLPQHAALFLNHDRMQERRRRQPRQERRVLDRIPRPVAAPSELDVRPPHAEHDADRQEEPREQRPAPHDAQPRRVEPAREQRRDRERERNRRRDVAEVQHRRMDRHARILQLRIHPASVGGRKSSRVERVRLETRRRDEEHEHQASVPVAHGISSRLRFAARGDRDRRRTSRESAPRTASNPPGRSRTP